MNVYVKTTKNLQTPLPATKVYVHERGFDSDLKLGYIYMASGYYSEQQQ
jgi:hypothetical protein